MRYTLQKVFVTILTLVFFIFGLSMLASGGSTITLGLGFTIIPAIVGVTNWIRVTKFQTQTYAWYRETYPKHAHTDGSVSCKNCGGRRIHIRGLLQHTYTREHVCGQCGTRLFYSPE